MAKESSVGPQKGCTCLVLHQKPTTCRPDGQSYKVNINFFPQKLFLKWRTEPCSWQLCPRNTRWLPVGCEPVKGRLARSPQEASRTSNLISTVISVGRWEATNNNIYKAISSLSNWHFPRANWWEGEGHPGEDASAPEQLPCLQLAFGSTCAQNTLLCSRARTHTRVHARAHRPPRTTTSAYLNRDTCDFQTG